MIATLERRSKKERPSDAFTLIELLVVIAIVVVVAGLVLTGLSAAKRKVQQTQCGNNVRQLGNALQLFLADFHTYPLGYKDAEIAVQYPDYRTSWDASLESELKALPLVAGGSPIEWVGQSVGPPVEAAGAWKGVWLCPSASPPVNLPPHRGFTCYGYNGFGLNPHHGPTIPNSLCLGLAGTARDPNGWICAPPLADSAVVSPSDMIAIGDGITGNDGVLTEDRGLSRWPGFEEDYLGSTKHAYSRHDGKANIGFCDGHVESPSFKTLFGDNSNAALRRWNRDHQAHRDMLEP